MIDFQPPPFRSHPLIRGGHLQTLAAIRPLTIPDLPTQQHVVSVGDGDALVLHDDQPNGWQPGDPSILVVHGLSGCHGSRYMIRLAKMFFSHGVRVFRADMRGCGAAFDLSTGLPHAGRSDDVLAALTEIDRITRGDRAAKTDEKLGQLNVAAISLGGALTLRMVGRIGAGIDVPSWIQRIGRIAVVAPPIDLVHCAKNMNRRIMRPYNRYFIDRLIKRVPSRALERQDFRAIDLTKPPKTLWAFDDLVTAPLSGFRDAQQYYAESSAIKRLPQNPFKTLILAAADDPVVPAQMFTEIADRLPATTQLHLEATGGHAGFIDRNRECWMDTAIEHWMTSDSA